MPNSVAFKTKLSQFADLRMAIIRDDLAPHPRAVLVSPASAMTAAHFNEILTLSRSLPFVILSSDRASSFFLEIMSRPRLHVRDSLSPSPFVAQLSSVEAREGIASGISASDRANTISVLGEDHPQPRRLVRPGHIFPVLARSGGTLVRAALPEAALDLTVLSNFSDAALFMDLLQEDGELLSGDGAQTLAESKKIPLVNLSEIVAHRLQHEQIVERVAEAILPTKIGGEFRSVLYRSKVHGTEHVALVKGDIQPSESILVRVQPEMMLKDVFGCGSSSSRSHIHGCLQEIARRGQGILIYLQRTPAGSPVLESPSIPFDERPSAMMREYGIGAQILRDLGVRRVELLSNSARQLSGLSMYGIEIVKHIAVPSAIRDEGGSFT